MLPIVMVVLDGASGRVGAIKSPLEEASTPNLDALAARGSMGRMYTVGEGIAPESDAGVFSLLGYDPLETHLSRGVVEALGAGVEFHNGDLALRAGFATVKADRLVDRRAGRNLSTPEAQELGTALNKELHLKSSVRFVFKPTVGHRAVVVFRADGRRFSSNISNFDPAYVRKGNISLAQPGVNEYDIPKCEPLDGSDEAVVSAALVNEFGFKARKILDSHPMNEARRRRGMVPANFVLMRDAGTSKPHVDEFHGKWGLDPLMVADLPAELGIGRLLGMDVRELEPGTRPNDYRKRAELVLDSVGKFGFVYVHLKGPDEPGHDGLSDLKKERIEEIDKGFFAVLAKSPRLKDLVVAVTCDHSTPVEDKGHSDDPVPVLVFGGKSKPDGSARFTENDAVKGSLGTLRRGMVLIAHLRQVAS
ncbi:2,3-bisphosphoglycerate-independent phosphoglycerate mutase [Candidatus Bathyarchaeota archaeon]|nr:MAG: 2,3-bisphosphoglycerate-independent phosphoglycerate mutase [Candidatus Bathyarchaeota archaeon]